ncbi:MAG: rhomboid family intramembrane serine protease [Nitrospirae bacterium]|nr:MAG: rhomboid family intramembrane serine protease [Nitrospirota bacterium]
MRRFQSGLTPAVKYLVIINSGIFLAEFLFRPGWMGLLGLAPASFLKGALWQPVTYMFLHGSIFHLLFNMLVLWMFGTTLEATWGGRRFLIFYFICGIGAGLLNTAVTPGSHVPIVGSSGAIYGLLMAFGILFPDQLIYIWGVFPVRARYFVIGLGLIELLTALGGAQDRIAHFAHLGGMLFGLVYMKWDILGKSVSGWRSGQKNKRRLKVVWDREQERRKLQEEIDRILDKGRKSGTGSLTAAERENFGELSRKLSELEAREQAAEPGPDRWTGGK